MYMNIQKAILYCNTESQYCIFELLVAMVTVILLFVYSNVINMVSFANETSKEVFKLRLKTVYMYLFVSVCTNLCTLVTMVTTHTRMFMHVVYIIVIVYFAKRKITKEFNLGTTCTVEIEIQSL